MKNNLDNYECDGQLCFVGLDLEIQEEKTSKKEETHNT